MHDYPPLLSGALHLLFKHFSQRAEVLQAFKQVWMGWILSQETQYREPFQRLLCYLNCCLLHDSAVSSEVKYQHTSLAVCAGVYYSSVPPEIVISGTAPIRENIGPWWALAGIPQGQRQCLMFGKQCPLSAVRFPCLQSHLGWVLVFCYSPGASNSNSGVFARGSSAWYNYAQTAGRQG